MIKRKSKFLTPSKIIVTIGLILGISVMIFGVKQINVPNKETNKLSKEEQIIKIQEKIDTLNTELASLKAKNNQEFFDSGLSENYYLQKNEISKKQQEIWDLESELSDLQSPQNQVFGTIKNTVFTSIYFVVGLVIIIVSIFIATIVKIVSTPFNINNLLSEQGLSYDDYEELDEYSLSKENIKNKNIIKKELYERLTQILTAYSEFDNKTIKQLTTPQVSKNYIDELNLLKKHNQKNIMKDFENLGSKLVDVKRVGNNLTIKIVQKIRLYDYILDKDNQVISGDKKKKQIITYSLLFTKNDDYKETIKKCPNCGATLSSNKGTNCEYCHTPLTLDNKDWLLSAKTILETEQ